MTPLPKRRHSSARSGKREKSNLRRILNKPNFCPRCKGVKLPHRTCQKCGFYR